MCCGSHLGCREDLSLEEQTHRIFCTVIWDFARDRADLAPGRIHQPNDFLSLGLVVRELKFNVGLFKSGFEHGLP